MDGNKYDNFIKEIYNILSQHYYITFYWLYEKEDIAGKEIGEELQTILNIPLAIEEIESFF